VLPAADRGLPPGAAAWLAIRPEQVQVVAPSDALLRGTVMETQFFGGMSTLAVEVAGHDAPVRVSQHGASRLARGAEVGLRWDPERVVVLADA
jgi:spermidine/putrescine transport system ATP-binding protein/putrescine transport system ATP-binding protein